ncbi:hypothetical protein MJO28_006345 [Puccinia striiformis f. sp. tritici]|uniref:Uncharacterized protein n=1 Tax=Puccinia striiformis f. sp. tritici TaxID=168172 RepID=A0ACC0EH69_9BASI|nr:hypothetical protein MJO28_006345 [Puccinia striiformis f. sp. tritici]
MSLLFNAPALAVDVGITVLHGFIGSCWLVVIYRTVSLGGQLAILSLPSSFPHYPSLSSASTTNEYWISIGCEILFIISLLEVTFSVYCLYLIRCAQAVPDTPPRPLKLLRDLMIHALGSGLDSDPLPTSPRGSANEKDLDPDLGIAPSTDFLKNPLPFDHPKAKDFRENHSIWFSNCRWEDIYRDNHHEWLCAALLNKSLKQVKEEDKLKSKEDTVMPHMEELLVAYEKRVGAKMPEGYNEYLSDRTIMLFKDPVRVTLRPLTLSYGLAWTSNEIIRHVLKYKGFKLKSSSNRKNGLKYFVRIPDSWKKLPPDQRPPAIIFVHGIGTGFLLYSVLIKYLTFSKWGNERPVMIFVQPHISMEIFSPAFFLPPNESQLTGDVKEAFENLGFYETGVELLAHSNGTVVAGWIIKAFPKLVKRSCLLDPICFALWSVSSTSTNFTFRSYHINPGICLLSTLGKAMFAISIEKLLRFGMAEELGTAYYTRRHFNWPDAVLWPHQVPGFRDPKRFIVILSGKDAILNAGRIRRYLLDGGMTDAFPRPQENSNSSQEHDEPLIQVEIDRQDSRPENGYASSGERIGTGGILFDSESAHGQTLVYGHPYLKAIIGWLEGNGIRLNENLQ